MNLLCMLMLTLCISCNDDFNNKSQSNFDVIACKVNITEADKTRGIPITTESDTAFKSIGIMGYYTEELFENTINPTSSFFANTQILKNKDNKWAFNQVHFWPQKGYISFFAYSPYANLTNGIVINNNQTNTPLLNYTLPHNVVNQPDLMIAAPQYNLFKTEVDLQFSHALACISFDVSGENVPIEYIGVKGVYTTGTLPLTIVAGAPKWESLSGLSNDLYEVGLIKDPIASKPSENIMATDGYLMMIPQQLDDNAAIVVKFTGMDPKVIPFKNTGTVEWKPGYKYNYSLKEGVYKFTVTANQNVVEYQGGNVKLNFTSTYTTQTNVVKNVGWKAEVVSISPNDTYWSDLFKDLSSTDGLVVEKNILINTSPYTTSNINDLNLRKADSIVYAQMKDLSFINNTYNTANTYIVNASGWYKIPCCVMGNGIKGGTSVTNINNSTCFSSTAPYFSDYLGNLIKDNIGLTLNTSNASPQLMWSDAPNLISNVRLSSDKNYIEFYISPQTIRQGNAIIAIQTEGKIMWSWQIWVTDWVLNTNNQVLGNGNPNIMPFAIGRCSAATYQYPQRSITIRFTQDESNFTQDITLTQLEDQVSFGENATFYQWGRKDPMLATDGLSINSKTCFGNYPFTISASSSPVSLNNAILNPNLFYSSSDVLPGNWTTPFYFNLWGNNSGASSSNLKSIYDPSPFGYQVPSLNTIFALESMQYKFVTSPIEGCQFSPNSNNDFSIFLAADGGRSLDGSVIGINVPQRIAFYWTNSSFYWAETTVKQQTFLNLIFPSKNEINAVYYQGSPGATALSVCSSVE